MYLSRRGAGAVERGSLENCWRRKALVGSNPTPSAKASKIETGLGEVPAGCIAAKDDPSGSSFASWAPRRMRSASSVALSAKSWASTTSKGSASSQSAICGSVLALSPFSRVRRHAMAVPARAPETAPAAMGSRRRIQTVEGPALRGVVRSLLAWHFLRNCHHL
jgi:hypothetical protein